MTESPATTFPQRLKALARRVLPEWLVRLLRGGWNAVKRLFYFIFVKTPRYIRKYVRILLRSGLRSAVRTVKADLQLKYGPAMQQTALRDEDDAAQSFQRITRLGDREQEPVVHLLAPTFFDMNGNNMYYGGAERYLVELHNVLMGMGYELVVFQCGNTSWVRYYHDLKVIGIETGGLSYALFNKRFHAWVPPAALTIYSPFSLAQPVCRENAIGISHGVFWDSYKVHPGKAVMDGIVSELMQAIKNTASLVSVDTNTINWTRSQEHGLSAKWNYIPNFVDLNQFTPGEARRQNGKVVVLYPRRLYEARGFWLLAEQIARLLKECPELEIHFVGKADPAEEAEVRHLEKTHPGKVKWFNLPPEEMQKAYQEADITVIPTLYSEGTSLSCLEAMACRNAVIATAVGGLTDLIQPDHNGLLIKPEGEALAKAILKLARNPALRETLAENARRSAETFSLGTWRSRWTDMLAGKLPGKTAAFRPRPQVVIPDAGGVNWDGIKQRPHHIARQLAANGREVFWRDDSPRGGISDCDHLHVLGRQDEITLDRPWMYIYYPYNYARAGEYGNPRLIYDVLDDISIHDESDRVRHVAPDRTARFYAQQLLEKADIVITSSNGLYETVKVIRPDALYVPNGIEKYDSSAGTVQTAEALRRIRKTHKQVVGFHGAVANWMDADLLASVIRSRPDYHFVFIGPVSDPAAPGYMNLHNVTTLGTVPYEQMRSYIAGFDAAIIPFKLNDITHGVRPLKALESLAMHKPVVATRLPEMADWPGVLFADEAKGFTAALDKALAEPWNHSVTEEVDRFINSNTWQICVKPLLDKMDALNEI
jgi:glycosyltransferase involved in cell wall biosynthesis